MHTDPTDTPTPFTAFFGRLFWMLLGPLFLALAAYAIVKGGGGWLTIPDIMFLAVAAGMGLGRLAEFRTGTAQTATGEPATPADLRKYLLGLAATAAGIFVLANLAGNHWLVP